MDQKRLEKIEAELEQRYEHRVNTEKQLKVVSRNFFTTIVLSLITLALCFVFDASVLVIGAVVLTGLFFTACFYLKSAELDRQLQS